MCAQPNIEQVSAKTEDQATDQKQCSRLSGKDRRRCNQWFSILEKYKLCTRCRATSLRNTKTDKGKLSVKNALKRYRDTDKGKATQKRCDTPEKNRRCCERRKASGTGQEANRKYNQSTKGKACRKRRDANMMNHLSRSLYKMVTGKHTSPVRFPKLGIFVDNADAQAHIASSFAPWMNQHNHGVRRSGMSPNTRWQIGHRIPKTWYRHDDIDEQKKCWSRSNLFAQCAVENTNAKDSNILNREQWLALKVIWPKQCALMTNEMAWLWAHGSVDNTTRRSQRPSLVAQLDSDIDPYHF